MPEGALIQKEFQLFESQSSPGFGERKGGVEQPP
jgi:hypothetical protein